MRTLLFLCILAVSGCVTQDSQVSSLQYEVRALKEDVTEMSKKLDKTSKTATSANKTATSASAKATKNAAKVEDVKQVADKALDTAEKLPAPRTDGESVIIKPREINHETSLFQ